ncbi:MAG: hypothetical protein AAB425_06770, partial [Bdellovibrionota bacterium]
FRTRSVRKTRRYLEAMETIFLVRKLPCHEMGVGKDAWLLADAGLATHLMDTATGEGAAISMARHCLLNEMSALFEYAGKSFFSRYFKSAKGSPVDLVVDQVPIRICPLSEPGRGPWGWHAKPVLGAMKSLGSDIGILAAPVDTVRRQGKLWIVPWSIWS